MVCDFDQCIDRSHTESVKWNRYDEDVLPMWVADMDFRAPEPVIQALHERVEHGVFGYGSDPPELREVIVERLRRLYDWAVSPEELLFFPGVVTAFNLVGHAFGSRGDGVLLQTPVCYPMLYAPPPARGLSG
jgi:cystathionine beta-lyase